MFLCVFDLHLCDWMYGKDVLWMEQNTLCVIVEESQEHRSNETKRDELTWGEWRWKLWGYSPSTCMFMLPKHSERNKQKQNRTYHRVYGFPWLPMMMDCLNVCLLWRKEKRLEETIFCLKDRVSKSMSERKHLRKVWLEEIYFPLYMFTHRFMLVFGFRR